MTYDDDEFDALPEGVDVAALQRMADEITSGAGGTDEEPRIEFPSDGLITLPGGFRKPVVTPDGTKWETVKKAWIRELNGEDEERIFKARRGDGGDIARVILEAGVEKLGDDTPTADQFDNMLTGDIDFLLLQISRATFGNDIEVKNFPCQNCGESLDFTIHKDEDIPVHFPEPGESLSEFEVRLSGDRVAKVNLVTGYVNRLMLAADTPPEANTVILANCVREIRGPNGVVEFDGDLALAKKLNLSDRRVLIDALAAKMPGPRYDGITFPHPACGSEVRVAVSSADLFLGL